jgi:cytochrome P450
MSSNYKLGPWKFPKDYMIIASVWFEGRDKTVWNEGVNGEHDVEDFWPDRFIVYPNDQNSGPRRPDLASAKSKSDKVKEPTFTVDSVNGSFIPYGGGQKMCPGRFYAKQEALGALAMFLNKFDIELKEKKPIVPDLSYFPMGILPPKGKYPARLRRRKEAA